MTASYDVAIVGLGAMGSAAAWHLARRGQRVLGLDRFTPPHRFGSTHGETRIIREAYFEHPLYVPLVQRAYGLWDELAKVSGRELLRTTGGLMIGHPDGQLVAGALDSARLHGLAHELLTTGEVRRRFPALQPAPDMVAVWEPRAGALFAEACVQAHLGLAGHHGAELRTDEPLLRWQPEPGGGCRGVTARGEFVAGQLLFTAGSWLQSLLPELDLPLRVERQFLGWFAPTGAPADFGPARCPVHLWESSPGRFFYGFPDFGGGVKLGIHHEGPDADPRQAQPEASAAEIAALRARFRPYLPGADGPLLRAATCLYTNTPDEHFWIDRHRDHPQVLVASPCSGHGFKFASAIGEGLADELSGQPPRLDLTPFRRRPAGPAPRLTTRPGPAGSD